MIRTLYRGIALLTTVAVAQAQVTPENVIEAVGQMTPAQIQELSTKLDSSYWKPIPEGFFSRMSARLDFSYATFSDVPLSGLGLSSADLDVENAGGGEFSLLWQVFAPELRLGFRGGSEGVADSDLTGAGYSRVELLSSHGALVASYQLVRSSHWILWIEGAFGSGAVDLETVNTPTGKATTLREYSGDYAMADARAGVSWRFNPVLSLHASAGYRFAEEVDLEEGGVQTGGTLDPSGFNAQLGLGINF